MSVLTVASPADLPALRTLLAGASGPFHFIAGGTDMLVNERAIPASGCIVNISHTQGLSNIAIGDSEVVIGAAVTLTALQRSPIVLAHLPVLAEAADLCGSVQIRNRATIGGNLVNASPAGDLIPILVCMAAEILIMGCDGEERIIPVGEFLAGSGRTALRDGELVVAIRIPLAPRLAMAHFVKLGPRDDLTISRLNLVVEADYAGGAFAAVRCVAGAIAPRPLSLPAVAAALAHQSLTARTAAAFLRALVSAVDGAIPGRASQPYKRRAVMGVGLDMLGKLAGDDCPSWDAVEALL